MNNVNKDTGIAYGVIDGNKCVELLCDIQEHGENLTWEMYCRDHTEKERDADNFGEDYNAEEESYEYTDSNDNQFAVGWLGGSPLIWCIKTSRITHAAPCSPCVPGAGNLDVPEIADHGGIKCYGIPKRYTEDRHCGDHCAAITVPGVYCHGPGCPIA